MQLSSNGHKKHICDRCLHYFFNEEQLKAHELDCSQINECKVILPNSKNNTLEFINFNHKVRVPLIVYADFECTLKPIEDVNQRAYQQHEPLSVGFFVQYSHDDDDQDPNNRKSKYLSYRKETAQGEDPARWFVDQLRQLADELEQMHENPVPMKDVDEVAFNSATNCHICGSLFSDKDKRVRDHCHLTGR